LPQLTHVSATDGSAIRHSYRGWGPNGGAPRRAAVKSDPGDAYILADILHIAGHRLKALKPQSDAITALRGLVRFDGNRYSVMAKAVGWPVEVHAYADRIVIRQDGEIVGEHPRRFGRDQTIYDPWHYVPVPARKPGAWRNGAPFKDWVLPGALERVRKRLTQVDDGGRQMVEIFSAVVTDGVGPVEAACAEALGEGVCSADVILNILARRRDVERPANILTPEALRLTHAPIADCGRYDSLRRAV